MKFVLCLRSQIAYDFLIRAVQKEEALPSIVFQKRNSMTLLDLEDAVEFFNADVYIVDCDLAESKSMIDFLSEKNLDYVEIKGEVRGVLPLLIDKYGLEIEEREIHYEVEEKERVVIQEKIIEKEVIRTAYQAIPSKVIVIGSLYSGAGSTILATNLARMVGERGIDVAYIEHPLIEPYMYEYLQIDNSESKPYVDISKEINSNGVPKSRLTPWFKHGVKWHVTDATQPQLNRFSYENLLVLSHAMQSTVIIVDISTRWLDPEIQKYLFHADVILMCVEPDPIKYDWSLFELPDYKKNEQLIMDFLYENNTLNHFEIALMKNVRGIDVKLLHKMFHKTPLVTLPYIPYQSIKKALFNSFLLYDFEENGQVFEDALIPVLAKVIPKEFIHLKKKKERSFKNLFTRQ